MVIVREWEQRRRPNKSETDLRYIYPTPVLSPAPMAPATPPSGAARNRPRHQPENASLSFDDHLAIRRPRPDVSAIATLMKKHLGFSSPSEDDAPVSPGSPSGGRVGMRPFYSHVLPLSHDGTDSQ